MNKMDYNIIERCKTGDIKAQFLLYKQYSKAMYNIAIRFLNNKMDAEDILQESFVKAFENISSLDHPGAFGSWLKRIVINNCITFLRSGKLYFEDINEQNLRAEESSEPVITVEPEVVHSAIKKLPGGARSILVLYALEGYKHREVAEMLNISESTSRTQYHRALKLLNESLKEIVYVN